MLQHRRSDLGPFQEALLEAGISATKSVDSVQLILDPYVHVVPFVLRFATIFWGFRPFQCVQPKIAKFGADKADYLSRGGTFVKNFIREGEELDHKGTNAKGPRSNRLFVEALANIV